MLPVIAEELGLPYSNREGWLSGIFQQLLLEENKEIQLGVCFPAEQIPEVLAGKENKAFLVKGVPCYAFRENLRTPEVYEPSMEAAFKEIFEDFKPDIIHVFGTEFPHALAAVKTFGNPRRTLVGIQGLCGEIAKVYMAGLPKKVQNRVTFRDFVRRDSLKQQQEKFVLRGKQETEIIKAAGNITGRTRFDREETAKINPEAEYFAMNETMRTEFYSGSWQADRCEPYSIFLSQGDYPLKGMHFALEALAKLLPEYPCAKLYVAGNSIVEHSNLKQRLKLSAYGKYLLELIKKYSLEDKVIVTGKLNAEEMKKQFLKSSVFICPSVLENSPNTVAEAMLLGMPVVASETGGIPDMITDGEDGLLFPVGDVDKLASSIKYVWTPKKEDGFSGAERLGKTAAERARMVHNGSTNFRRLLEIYDSIA